MMKRSLLLQLGICLLTCLTAIPLRAQSSAPAAATRTEKTTTGQATATGRNILAPAETLTGRIWMVDPANRLVVVRDASGVPFDFVISRSTRIKSSIGTLTLHNLISMSDSQVRIKFLPERRGDVAVRMAII